nr:SAP30_Sin3_bdg domain-containing protein [Ipomoea batatas]
MRRSQSSFTLLLNANTTYNLLLIPSLQHRKDISKNLRTVSTLDCFDLETSSSIAFSQGVEKHKKQERYACRQILQVLTNGIEVKFQRNALSVIDVPTGNEEDDDLEFKNFQWNGSDMGE